VVQRALGNWYLESGLSLERGLLPLSMYVCPECGRVELFAYERMKWDLIMGAQGNVEKKEG
jgi:hypothetical protein